LPGGLSQSYYDISLVDGYNLPLAIEVILDGTSPSQPLPNTTNPSCVGSIQGFAQTPFNPYSSGRSFLNTTSQTPLPFESDISASDISKWCRCTGKYGSAKKCHANYYAIEAKKVCPDAYSYAFDDASSTFTAPTGSGFEVIFCPGGRSTMIQKTPTPSAAGNVTPKLGLILAVITLSVLTLLG
jgi:hypothetical protein